MVLTLRASGLFFDGVIMAKDDYEVIAYKILLYLYSCMKRITVFDTDEFNKTVRKNVESDEYFANILRLMQKEGLIEGVLVKKVWGACLLISDLKDMEITADGIRYLKDNSKIEKARTMIMESADLFSNLIGLLHL